ncbi:MAG TPA: hypothetical protein VN706_16360 [Gemmatimonadaceae bacterium]|nr:hypothetical protein [Gemmatimonadaceae bacterium]
MHSRLLSWVSGAALVLAVSAAAQAQQVTSKPCKDGTPSTATGRGACSGHGGVDGQKLKAENKAANDAKHIDNKIDKADAKMAKGAAKPGKGDAKIAKAESKADKAEAKLVKCTDGTSSKGGRGACSGHGGIARGLKK